jgi:ATP-dependent DNA helicase RecG
VADDTGSLKVVWFNQPFLAKALHPGDTLWMAGKVEQNVFGTTLVNPTWEKRENPLHAAGIIPIYPLTEGLTQKQMRMFMHQALPLASSLRDILPPGIEAEHNLLTQANALKALHDPTNFANIKSGKRRIAFEELLIVHLAVQQERARLAREISVKIPFHQEHTVSFVQRLPFTLTPDQKRAAWDILQDMDKPQPMNRLLEGDVGSGKTVVAAIGILNVATAGYQVAYLAPTEILAQQHYEKISALLKPFGTRTGILTQSTRRLSTTTDPPSRTKIVQALAEHQVDLIIGTHALLSKAIKFSKLALVIVDEQHRFGVEQRKALRATGSQGIPHFLSMTATPIPRTLALTVWGDLTISRITHLPKERKAIATKLLDPRNRDVAYQHIREKVLAGEQAFIIYPRIDTDPTGAKSATAGFNELKEKVFPDITLGLIHGRLPSNKKEQAMREFADGKIKILIATAVVEVGIDVPNATAMLIEGAENFGLAQLHQLRGRIGRSNKPSTCFILSESQEPEVIDRLKVLMRLNDGFQLAEEDLQRRGPGEIFGIQQSGFQPFRMARLTDTELIEETRQTAEKLLLNDPDLINTPSINQIVLEKRKQIHPE